MVHVGHSSYVIGDKVYFTLRNSNIIGVLSVIDGKFDYILGPLEESPYQNDLYGGICVFNNKIVLCPYNAKKIWMYDICTGKWESFDVPWQGIGRQDSQFTGMYLFNEKVFMFGDHANDIYVFDIVERKGEYILNKKNQMWGSSFAVIEDKLYIGISYINQIIVIDLNSYAQKNIVVSELADIAGIQIVDNMICCIPRSGGSGKLVLLNREGKLVDSYNIPLIEILRGTVAFGDELLIYGIGRPAISFNIKTYKIKETVYEIFMATNYYEDGYVAMTFDGKIIYYNKGNINIYNIVINKDIWDKYLCCINEKHRITRNITIIDEDEFFNLKYFIKTIRRIK